MLKDKYIAWISAVSGKVTQGEILWKAIDQQYQQSNRHYHTLHHLEQLYKQLTPIRDTFKDWEMVIIAICYHDYIYAIQKKNNEDKSAEKAKEILQSLAIDHTRIAYCYEMIIATKTHQHVDDIDINHFTDADITILGSDWNTYLSYTENIRKEYKYYPDFLYNKGRVKVIQHFIAMPQIFKTAYFFEQFEAQARQNLNAELTLYQC